MLSTIIRWDLSQPQVQHWWKMAEFAAESGQLRRVFKCMRWLTLTICLVSLFRNITITQQESQTFSEEWVGKELQVNTAKVVAHTVRENSHKVENNVLCSLDSWLLWLMLRKSNHILALLPAWTCNMWHYRYIFYLLFFSRGKKHHPRLDLGLCSTFQCFLFNGRHLVVIFWHYIILFYITF